MVPDRSLEGNQAALEELRQAVVHASGVLGMGSDPVLQEIVARAAQRLNVPIAAASILDGQRQWFPAAVGLLVEETPRSLSFCNHAIREPGEVLIVPDATADARFATNVLVTGEPGIRFYAGIPLTTPDGAPIGALCVIDRQAHRAFGAEEQAILRQLGQEAMAEIGRAVHVHRDGVQAVERIVEQIRRAAAADDEPLLLGLDKILRLLESRLTEDWK